MLYKGAFKEYPSQEQTADVTLHHFASNPFFVKIVYQFSIKGHKVRWRRYTFRDPLDKNLWKFKNLKDFDVENSNLSCHRPLSG